MTTSRQTLGQWGETLAAGYLEDKGYTLLERNTRTPYGEIDLIACQEGLIIFVEVKSRTTRVFGNPEVAVTPRKQAHMLAAAQYYIQQHPEHEGAWRIDVIAIQRYRIQEKPLITHFENVIS